MFSQMMMTLPELQDHKRCAQLWRYSDNHGTFVVEGEHDAARDVVQGTVVESDDPQFPVGLPWITLKRKEVTEA